MLKEPPSHVTEAVTTRVLRDLEPSLLSVHAKVGVSALVGGVLSLMLCGQFGIGVTSWAEMLNHRMHAHLDSVTCALACGVMYAIFPIIVLRFFLTPPLQFRVILRRYQPVLLLWFAGFGGVLTLFGDHGQGIIEYAAWVVAALVAANVCARLANVLLPHWHPRHLLMGHGL